MNWQALILISVFLSSFSTILQRVLLKDDKGSPIAFSILFQFIGTLIVAAFGIGFGDFSFDGLYIVLQYILIMTLLYGTGVIFYFKSLQLVEASEFSIIFSSRVLFAIAGTTLLLREALTPSILIGAILIILGVIIVTLKSTKINFTKGELFAFLAALTFGLTVVTDRFLLQNMDFYTYIFLVFLLPGIFATIVYTKQIKGVSYYLNIKLFPRLVLAAFLQTVTVITFFAALKVSPNSSLVVLVNLTSVIFTVVLSIVVLKERERMGGSLLEQF